MNKLLLIVVFLFCSQMFAAATSDSGDAQKSIHSKIQEFARTCDSVEALMSSVCEFGLTDLTQVPVLLPNFLQFMDGSKREISALLANKELGTVVVLGIGAANEIPIEMLIKKSARLILIDGNLAPVKQMLKAPRLAKLDKGHVTLIQQDLTGGYYDLLRNRSAELEAYLLPSFTTALLTRKIDLTDYVAFLKNELVVDIAIHKPDVVIASLVASQLYPLTTPIEDQIVTRMVKPIDDGTSQFLETVTKFSPIAGRFARRAIERAFFHGLLTSGASTIYFADTNITHLDQIAFDNFINDMKTMYHHVKRLDAWHYRHDAPVSWFKFSKEMLCGFCGAPTPPKKCPCNTVHYCNVEHQRAHWNEHKETCSTRIKR